MSSNPIVVAQEVLNVPELASLLERLGQEGYDYALVPLANPLHQREPDSRRTLPERTLALTRTDTILPSYDWTNRVVGQISTWLNFDSSLESVRLSARQIFKQELAWASHLNLSAVALPPPDWNCANFASTINSAINNQAHCRFWIEVPLVSKKRQMLLAQAEKDDPIHTQPEAIQDDPWERWNRFRTFCHHSSSLQVVLEITDPLPSEAMIARWLAEPLAAIILPVDIWLTNPSGFPVLSKAHQALVKRLMGYNIQVIVRGIPRTNKPASVYPQYIRWLQDQIPPLSDGDQFEKPYWDYLQSPLQPLMDNLESQTYEVFEKDPIKYQKYEEAVAAALAKDPFLQGKDEVVLMVLGAGRGPLVKASMRAAITTGRKLKLYAVEKNPNAVNTLRNLRDNDPAWKNVTIISSDIRVLPPPELADVVVSELLGSFGDNELSPECLYGAQRLLKPGGISIPSNYVSFVQPLASTKLWSDAAAYKTLKNMETAYVCKFHAVNLLSEAQPCFTFVHPNYEVPLDNDRHATLTFKLKESALVHGFAGYFDSELYPGVNISIYPPTFTTGMFSWFPLYFPIQTPLYVPADTEVTVEFWRLSSPKQVWYEWAVSAPSQTHLHNSNGRSWWIGL